MEFKPTCEQKKIIKADLTPQCVIACPGSGKTTTAVRRLVEIRRQLNECRSHVALFSYSNIAVNTFRKQYGELAKATPGLSARTLIETVDSFLTTYVLRPHGARTMGASRQPFLVQGSEPFLGGYKLFDGKYPHDISELRVRFKDDGDLDCTLEPEGKQPIPIESWKAFKAIRDLGKTGAYTHELGRYWAIRALSDNKRLLAALCRRYPHIIVDEAQDIGPLHGHLLSMLSKSGASISLIGDPNQGIFDFTGADGRYLKSYSNAAGVAAFPLSQNRRSVRDIVEASNKLAGTSSTPFREPGPRKHGAYYIRYDDSDYDSLMSDFFTILNACKYEKREAVAVCRGNSAVDKLVGGAGEVGRGATSYFAQAAILRDRSGDIAKAYEYCVNAILRLIQSPPEVLRKELLATSPQGDTKILRRMLWSFLRSSATGIPDAKIPAKSQWHPVLKERLTGFLSRLEADTGFKRSPTWGNNLTVADLDDFPLWDADFTDKGWTGVRVDTVHQVKGEGIPVVLYIAKTSDLRKLLEGPTSEEGRIGYVAVTRARDLLLLGVPKTAAKSLLHALEGKGFKAWEGSFQ